MLEKVFGVFYQLGQTLDFYLRSKELFTATAEIQSILTHTYSDLVRLTVDVGIYYKKKCTSGSSTLAGEFDVEFGHTVDSFFYRKECFTSEVWNCSLRLQETSETDISIHIIRRWLATQDRTLDLFLSDRMGTRTARFEYTCEWFETHLKDFQRSTSDVMWVTGQSGCGKTTLTGWILERLKRTQGLRSGSDVVSFSIGMLHALVPV